MIYMAGLLIDVYSVFRPSARIPFQLKCNVAKGFRLQRSRESTLSVELTQMGLIIAGSYPTFASRDSSLTKRCDLD